jgi:hypothetical protein
VEVRRQNKWELVLLEQKCWGCGNTKTYPKLTWYTPPKVALDRRAAYEYTTKAVQEQVKKIPEPKGRLDRIKNSIEGINFLSAEELSEQICPTCAGGNKIIDSFFNGRDYELFGHLAGVRGQVDPITGPRGVPNDMSEELNKQFHPYSGQVPASWYTLKELQSFQVLKTIRFKTFQKTLREMEKLLSPGQDSNEVRAIFWFD